MKILKVKADIVGLSLVLATVLSGCQINSDEKDMDPPQIHTDFEEAFPVQCSVVERGEEFVFKARLTDNMELGSFSLDIHHNFDHHTHSTEVNDCEMDPVKTPENPFLLIESYSIPEGMSDYEAMVEISVPQDVDPGDYHLMIKVTDREGWQAIKGISIQII